MKKIILFLFVSIMASNSYAQKYFTKDGQITFLSNAPMEDISAINKKGTCVIDIQTGNIEWAVLINAFKFEKALMEEHFNENYMESTKFPKATFKGTLNNIEEVDFSKDGSYKTGVKGNLEIRGIQKEVSPEVIFNIEDGKINGVCEFKILVADYDIEIPKLVRENIAKEVMVSINANYQLLK